MRSRSVNLINLISNECDFIMQGKNNLPKSLSNLNLTNHTYKSYVTPGSTKLRFVCTVCNQRVSYILTQQSCVSTLPKILGTRTDTALLCEYISIVKLRNYGALGHTHTALLCQYATVNPADLRFVRIESTLCELPHKLHSSFKFSIQPTPRTRSSLNGYNYGYASCGSKERARSNSQLIFEDAKRRSSYLVLLLVKVVAFTKKHRLETNKKITKISLQSLEYTLPPEATFNSRKAS